GIRFWLYGNNTGATIQMDLLENRNQSVKGDSAERWFYRFDDNYAGWKSITVPFAEFQRRTDFQPNGAPDDGLGLAEVSGYAFIFPANVGAQVAYLDDVSLVNAAELADTTSAVTPTEEATSEVDSSIDWNSRQWTLAWSDEFEGAAGTPVDSANWTPEIGGDGWGNGEFEYYTDRPENASLDGDGNLAIVARQEKIPGSQCFYGNCLYTSARLITQGHQAFTYGRIEARIKIPRGQGMWPAFWMLGTDIDQVGWPNSGEIDIMENIGKEPQIVHGTIHGPGYSGGSGITAAYTGTEDFADDFHVYAIDWDPTAIRWYVDGKLYSTVSVNDLHGRKWVYDHDFFILLNVAVGGQWPGAVDTTTQFPQTMLVDYVRVYNLASGS
ncbi:MAG: family 16 glycosylhydrolase, partial [Chloroflexota bacterium]